MFVELYVLLDAALHVLHATENGGDLGTRLSVTMLSVLAAPIVGVSSSRCGAMSSLLN